MRVVNAVLLAVIGIELVAGFRSYRNVQQQPVAPTANTEGLPGFTRNMIMSSEVAMNPKFAEQWSGLGMVYQAFGFYDESVACFTRAQEISPEDPSIAYELGFALILAGKTDESSREFERAMELGHPYASQCWYFLGRNALRMDDPETAKGFFLKATSLPAARFELAKIAWRAGESAQAEHMLKEIINEFPNATEPQRLLAEVFDEQGEQHLASMLYLSSDRRFVALTSPRQEIFESIQQLRNVGNVKFVQTRATELLDAGKVSDAQEILKYEAGSEFHPVIWDARSDVERALGNIEEQIALLQEIIERDGLDSYRAARLGFALIGNEQKDEVQKVMTVGAALESNDEREVVADLYQQLANLASEQGNEDKALANWSEAQFHYGRKIYQTEDPSKAIDLFIQSAEANPETADPLFYLGQLFYELGELTDAQTAYEECLKIDPNFGRAIDGLALVKAIRNSGGEDATQPESAED
ncbi:tetratricopeptide repeat protein [Thalassoglobus neptunius]|uniref:Tetratricopeptide repeat protein n=1 Tax=Thalassoglobus neptunius TaxID=1938619 RepID=A0A5C5X520_9PLAN|nr:tetratricopeptide repeat protein [Thalassoglobus neptunius]TWT58207.1 tetratricopeptide repeat protein [Thalassoglobus neptunius]